MYRRLSDPLVWVTGGNGQVASEIRYHSHLEPSPFSFLFTDREVDITNPSIIQSFLSRNNPSAIINCAAYTDVNRAESDRERAYSLNTTAVSTLGHLAYMKDIPLIHLSTDFVYDGCKSTPYTEKDKVCPLNVYGETKAEGDRLLMIEHPMAVIIRTSWVYSSYGKNFFRTITRLSQEQEELKIVADQIGTPTYARDLAHIILRFLSLLYSGGVEGGVYHFSNEGETSWYGFACEIIRLLHSSCRILPIRTEEYPSPAMRPKYSVLSKGRICDLLNFYPRSWQDALSACIASLDDYIPKSL